MGGLWLFTVACVENWQCASGKSRNQEAPSSPDGVVASFVISICEPKSWMMAIGCVSSFAIAGDLYAQSRLLDDCFVCCCGLSGYFHLGLGWCESSTVANGSKAAENF